MFFEQPSRHRDRVFYTSAPKLFCATHPHPHTHLQWTPSTTSSLTSPRPPPPPMSSSMSLSTRSRQVTAEAPAASSPKHARARPAPCSIPTFVSSCTTGYATALCTFSVLLFVFTLLTDLTTELQPTHKHLRSLIMGFFIRLRLRVYTPCCCI